jgi:hypothetical protein
MSTTKNKHAGLPSKITGYTTDFFTRVYNSTGDDENNYRVYTLITESENPNYYTKTWPLGHDEKSYTYQDVIGKIKDTKYFDAQDNELVKNGNFFYRHHGIGGKIGGKRKTKKSKKSRKSKTSKKR